MAELVPNGNIQFFKGIPLNNNYENTFYFENKYNAGTLVETAEEQQLRYFTSLRPMLNGSPDLRYLINPTNYQRVTRNSVKVGLSADFLRDCNYMAFQNAYNIEEDGITIETAQFKWFYAFITNIEYISPLVCEVIYEIDLMQSYLPNTTYVVSNTLIDRQHSERDDIYYFNEPNQELLVDEGLNTGEYYYEEIDEFYNDTANDTWVQQKPFADFSNTKTVYWTTIRMNEVTVETTNISPFPVPNLCHFWFTEELTDISGTTYIHHYLQYAATLLKNMGGNVNGKWSGILGFVGADFRSGSTIYGFPSSNPAAKAVVIYRFVSVIDTEGLGDEIVGISEVPKVFTDNITLDWNTYPSAKVRYLSANYTTNTGFENYFPKNKKLYTSPYNVMCIETDDGNSVDLRFEYFTPTTHSITINGQASDYPVYEFENLWSATPIMNVCLIPRNYNKLGSNYRNMITLSDFYQYSYANNMYLNWLARNKNEISAERVNIGLGAVSATVNTALSAVGTIAGGSLSANGIVGRAMVNTIRPSGDRYLSPSFNESMLRSTTSANLYANQIRNQSMLNAGVGAASGVATSLFDAVGQAVSLNAKINDAKLNPSKIMNNTNPSNTLSAYNEHKYRIYIKRLRAQYARQIDSFFTLYGYKVGRMGYIIYKARKYYTYVKTVNCNIVNARMPQSYLNGIKDIYDNGIRFWRWREDLGDTLIQVGQYDFLNNIPSLDE